VKQMAIAIGKRKTAVATAIIKPGSGRVYVNGIPIELYQPEVARWKILEPLLLLGDGVRSKIDVEVKAKGGGFMGQAIASRTAIARALTSLIDDPEVKKIFTDYDRHMLTGDHRRTEPKKPRGRSARAKRQKSYR